MQEWICKTIVPWFCDVAQNRVETYPDHICQNPIRDGKLVLVRVTPHTHNHLSGNHLWLAGMHHGGNE